VILITVCRLEGKVFYEEIITETIHMTHDSDVGGIFIIHICIGALKGPIPGNSVIGGIVYSSRKSIAVGLYKKDD